MNNQRELIRTIYGTNDIMNDVKQVYLDELKKQDQNIITIKLVQIEKLKIISKKYATHRMILLVRL